MRFPFIDDPPSLKEISDFYPMMIPRYEGNFGFQILTLPSFPWNFRFPTTNAHFFQKKKKKNKGKRKGKKRNTTNAYHFGFRKIIQKYIQHGACEPICWTSILILSKYKIDKRIHKSKSQELVDVGILWNFTRCCWRRPRWIDMANHTRQTWTKASK